MKCMVCNVRSQEVYSAPLCPQCRVWEDDLLYVLLERVNVGADVREIADTLRLRFTAVEAVRGGAAADE